MKTHILTNSTEVTRCQSSILLMKLKSLKRVFSLKKRPFPSLVELWLLDSKEKILSLLICTEMNKRFKSLPLLTNIKGILNILDHQLREEISSVLKDTQEDHQLENFPSDHLKSPVFLIVSINYPPNTIWKLMDLLRTPDTDRDILT